MFHIDVETEDKLLATRTGLHAKYLSKTIKQKDHLRETWNTQRRSVMYAIVRIKFRNVGLCLLDT